MIVARLLEQVKVGIENGYINENSKVFFSVPGEDGFILEIESTCLPALIHKTAPKKRGVLCFTNVKLPQEEVGENSNEN
ncbi:MAG: hypothetical protein M0P61_00155 [Ignavibacteriaceae bacterium]|nr:hypothetical protein [Ignavibacteriaceae bacterium]